jgi:alpha-galactosidase
MPPENRPATSEGAVVALTTAGVTLLVETTGGGVPSVVHWGPELPGLDATLAASLLDAGRAPVGPNDIDKPIRLAVLPEHATGWAGRPGLVGSRAGRGWSPRFRHLTTTLDGDPVEGFVAGGPGLLEVRSVDEEAGLDLVVRLELLPSGLVRGQAEVINRGGEPYQLDGLTLALPVPAEAGELLDFSGRWARERAPQRRSFTVGTHLRENRRGRTGADSAYVLHAGTPGFGFASGEVYAVHTAFSGDHVHYAERTHTGARVLGGGELLLPGEIRLAQGESYTSPWVYGVHGTGLDATAHRFHAHLRGRPRPVGPDRPVTLNVWEAVYFDHDTDRLLDLAERAAALGVERYVLDDGWFGSRRDDTSGLGDWVVSADVWPDGLHPLVDRVHELGMQFGLWFEPEMVNADSDVARAHPEWVMAARSEWPVESRHQQVLNLGIPGAYEHVKGQMLALLDEYTVDYIKWDHNRDLVEAGTQPDGGRPGVHEQTLAFYRLVDELRAAHPDLEIESCSSGGARVDLGVLERTDRVWVSDCIDPLERQHMVRWTAQLLPPELMGAHIASGRSHTTGRVHDLGFRASTAVFGHLGIEWDLAQASPEELRELGAWLEFYKENRGLLLTGAVIRMDGYDDHLLVHGVVAQERSEAVFAMALVGSLESSPGPRIRFRGLDPGTPYRVRPLLVGAPPSGLRAPGWWGTESDGYPGCVLTGAALEHVGVVPPVVNPDNAVLFRIERV